MEENFLPRIPLVKKRIIEIAKKFLPEWRILFSYYHPKKGAGVAGGNSPVNDKWK